MPHSPKHLWPLLGILFSISVSQSKGEPSDFGRKIKPFFENHCIQCHGPKKEKGDIRLDQLPATIDDNYSAETWQEVLDVLNAGEMPPEDEPQPKTGEMAAAIAAMTDELYEARKRLIDPESVTIRRLNKREYANTIRDLLGVPIDTANLPADGTLDGFDTVGDAHFMSVSQFESYLNLGRTALNRALVSGAAPARKTSRINPEKKSNKKALDSIRKIAPGIDDSKRALADPNLDENDRKHHEGRLRKTLDTLARAKGYLAQPASESGFILDITQAPFGGQAHDKVSVGLPWEPQSDSKHATLGRPIGSYLAKFRVGLTCKPKNGERLFVEVIRTDAFNMQVSYRHSLGTFEITRTIDDPHLIEVPFENKGTLKDLIAVRVSNLNPVKKQGRGENFQFPDSTREPYIWVDWLEVDGPILEEWPPAAWQSIFFKGTDQSADQDSDYAMEILTRFTRRAFRGREPDPEFLDKLHAIFLDHRGTGASFVDAIRESLAVVLASPSFVYLVEKSSEDDKPKSLGDFELASRLSYFLWSHPPDAELLDAASKGILSRPTVLRSQVERMLNDPKSKNFTEAFMNQWLELDWLDMIVINESKFPKFNEDIRRAMRQEPGEMFREMIRNDLSVTNFIDSDFVMLDSVLAKYYGLDLEENRPGFQPVKLPPNSPRGGLLGTGAVLTMTGTGERTSPVERGVFVYSRMLGKSIPPPPPNVPQLVLEDGENLTVRQVLQAHTDKAQCASCHQRMDPLGFGLEHFDAIGLWRDSEERTDPETPARRRDKATRLSIDATGSMPDRKRAFNGHEELKAFLMEDQDAMAGGFLKAILTYGLGRRVGFSDGEFVEQLQARWKSNHYTMRKLIHDIVQSETFRTK